MDLLPRVQWPHLRMLGLGRGGIRIFQRGDHGVDGLSAPWLCIDIGIDIGIDIDVLNAFLMIL